MKKAISIILLVVLFLSLPTVSAVETMTDGKTYRWYFKAVKGNKQPEFDLDLEELKNYGAYAIGNKDEKVIYLTFDFGYENGNVKKCLDTLNSHNVKGTFFILENVVKTNADLLKEMVDTGHVVANHTLKHRNMCTVTDFEAYRDELSGLDKLYEETTGHKLAGYYRPPKGEFTKQNLEYSQKLGYKTIFWSLAYMDWDNAKQPDPQVSIERLMQRAHNGMILLLHPTSSTNAQILGELITRWKSEGYRFALLDELK